MVLLAICFAGVAGCGTFVSRNQPTVFGAYPYQAVADDGLLFADTVSGDNHCSGADIGLVLVLTVVSLPIDICADTILLPVDAICWANGKKKTKPSWGHFPAGD